MVDFVTEANTLIQKFILEFQNLQAGVIDQVKFNVQQIVMLNTALEKVNAENIALKKRIEELEISTPKDENMKTI